MNASKLDTPALLDFTGLDAIPSQILWNDHYFVDDARIAEAFGPALSPRLADLVDVATCCYVADRLTRRPRHLRDDPYGLSWARRLNLRIPVRDVSFWETPDVTAELRSLLGWLTDDLWTFEWSESDRDPRFAETHGRLFGSIPDPENVVLFSCGLDSVAGVVRHLQSSSGSLVLVNVGTSSRMRSRVEQITTLLHNKANRVHALSVPLTLRATTDPNRHEPSQRTRGFVFLAFGAVAAASAGRSELIVWENGIGAVNLPYSEAQEGSKSTRAVHPHTLASASRLLSYALGPFSIRCPSIFRTKALQCADLPSWSKEVLNLSVSCDTGFVHRASRKPLCGFCTSCLLRRQGLRAAGLSDVDARDEYRFDVLDKRTSGDQRMFTLDAMLTQAAFLHDALGAANPWGAVMERFPSAVDAHDGLTQLGYSDEESRANLLELLKRYVEEWGAFPSERLRWFLPHLAKKGLETTQEGGQPS
jgi:7-cyano-7-deazaguanine synthase in queuosine biosynthesis